MADAYSESLNYRSMKSRAVAARSFRVKIPSSNSTSFTPGQTINIDLPGNLAGQFYNFNQMYLKFKVKNSHTHSVTLDRAGSMSFIKRIQISTAGALLQDLNNWNVLATALMDTSASPEWKASNGNILLGTRGGVLAGEKLISDEERVYCIPMVLNVLGNTTPHRLIPAFSLGAIQFKITLDDSVNYGKWGNTAAPASAFSFTEVEMVTLMTELSPGAMAQVDALNSGQYNILCTSWMNTTASQGTETNLVANLGISVSSLERIIMCCRPNTSLGQAGSFSLGNRCHNGLKQYQYIINSEGYPSRPIIVEDKGAEAYAEFLLSSHALVNFRDGCGIQSGCSTLTDSKQLTGALDGNIPNASAPEPYGAAVSAGDDEGKVTATAADGITAVSASNIGTFISSVELESGLSDGKSASIYSGISTISSTTQFRGEYSGAQAAQLDFFASYSVLLSLDTRGTGIWSISV
jgi:hypothetical protein